MEIQKRHNETRTGIQSAESSPVADENGFKRFRIVKLEERIAPSNVSVPHSPVPVAGFYMTNTCGPACNVPVSLAK